MELKDANLFHEKCYVDGAWIDADSGEHHSEVTNPATDEIRSSARIPKMGADENPNAPSRAPRTQR